MARDPGAAAALGTQVTRVRLPASLVIVAIMARGVSASPLREQITDLACGDGSVRQRALLALEQAPRGMLGLPDESLGAPATDVNAYVIDRLLEVLGEVRQRDPAIAARIDALVTSWNYCSVTANEHAWDLRIDGPTVQRTQQPYPSTTAGRGFTAWGLIPRRAGGRPTIPDLGEPKDTCDVALLPTTPSGSLAAPHLAIGPDPTCEPPRGLASQQELSETRVQTVIRPVTPLASQRLPARPGAAIGTITAGSGVPQLEKAGVSASVFFRQALAGKLDSGIQLSWSPWTSTFVRLGATWPLARDLSLDASAKPTWSLGIGYDDWHPGTWSFQINQWGPSVPADGWKIASTATAELAYKVKLGDSLGARLGLKLAASSKLTWSPTIGAAVSVKLPHAWFASVGAATSLTTADRPTWTYVLGRSTWRARSLSIILANFGPNRIPEANFVAHSAITASWGWAW